MITGFLMAGSKEKALELKMENSGGSMFLAGGTEINRLKSSVAPTSVVSLKNIGLDTLAMKDGLLHIGSGVTLQQLVDSPLVPAFIKDAAVFCGSRTRRNMATIGGNIALVRDDSYLMPTLVAAKARLVMAGYSKKSGYTEENIPIREYLSFKDHFADALILCIVLDKPNRFVASSRFAKTVQSPAAVTVSFGADILSGKPQDVRICAAVKNLGVIRFPGIEDKVAAQEFIQPEDVMNAIPDNLVFVDDITGTGVYKKYILGTAIERMYRTCLESCRKGGTAC
ncbi:MAG: xanthine dehydrogenase family protein subunit M [Sphaerochaetaceae bacterium]